MALSNYTELKSAIANWLNRSDLTTEIAGDFITLAEADFNAKLRIRQMHSQSTLTVNAETFAVPTGFTRKRFLHFTNNFKISFKICNASTDGSIKRYINRRLTYSLYYTR